MSDYKISNSNIRFISIIEILKKYSDKNHPISTQEIINLLEKEGLSCERKCIYKTIKSLSLYGWDVNKTYKPKKGFYLGKRAFESAEIKLLSDAILSANFINDDISQKILRKLKNQLSIYQSDNLHLKYCFSKNKNPVNIDFLKNIDIISYAVKNNFLISFNYCHTLLENNKIVFDSKKRITVYPFYLSWFDDNYNLFCYNTTNKKNKIYHVNKMLNLDFNTKSSNEFFNINSSSQKCTFICKNELFENVIDKFSNVATIKTYSSSHFKLSINAPITENLIAWILQNSEYLYIKEPFELKKFIKNKIKRIYNIYFNDAH